MSALFWTKIPVKSLQSHNQVEGCRLFSGQRYPLRARKAITRSKQSRISLQIYKKPQFLSFYNHVWQQTDSIYHIVILTTLSLLIIKDLRSSFLIFTPKNSQFLKPQNLLQLLLISICFSREIEATI